MSRIKTELTTTFDEVYGWFSVPDDRLYYSPQDGGWSIAKILEHITLTNHYLLILIRKGTIKALEKSRAESYRDLLNDYELDWDRLELIGQPGAFKWHRPEHMEPGVTASLETVRADMQRQIKECLDHLDQIKQGEGVLYKTMMTVNGLGKIDVYHYICFLVQHAKRHIVQMQKLDNRLS